MAYHRYNDRRSEQLRCAVPARFQRLTGLDKYEFYVWDFLMPFNDESMILRLHRLEKPGIVIVEKRSDQLLFEALSLTGSLRFQHPHFERFMRIYKSLECLSKPVKQEFRAIRHSLSHSSPVLSHRATVSTLNRIFGSVKIDLARYKHRKEFYRYFSLMLMENDQVLFAELYNRIHIFFPG